MSNSRNIRIELMESRQNTTSETELIEFHPDFHQYRTVTSKPDKIIDDRPIVVVPGFSESLDQVEIATRYIAYKTGRFCVGLEVGLEALHNRECSHMLSVRLRDEVLYVASTLEERGPVSVVAHSAGAIATAHAAQHEPGLVDTFVAWSPAGLNPDASEIDPHRNIRNLLKRKNIRNLGRFALMTGVHASRRLLRDADHETVGYLRNGARRLSSLEPSLIATYLNYISLADVREDVAKAIMSGVNIGLVHGNRDAMFPRAEIESSFPIDALNHVEWMTGPKVNGHFPMGSFGGLRQIRNYILDTEERISQQQQLTAISLAE